jgi:hypothetical protein
LALVDRSHCGRRALDTFFFTQGKFKDRTAGPPSGNLAAMRLPRIILSLAVFVATDAAAAAAEKPRPLMRDFIGLNGHTVVYKPELYAPVAKLVRDYHPFKWDVGEDTSFATTFPFARNKVDWNHVYGSWRKAGLRVNASLIFDDVAPDQWKDLSRDPAVYGEAFARAFGPSSTAALVESAEVGNEPGKYSDAQYRQLFEAMAGGLRKGDPKLRIAPCALNLGPSGRYSKSVDTLSGLESLYDILNIHLYAEVEGWPTWRRSYPEDPKIEFLNHLRSVLSWRREHAPDKELWLTEFGWDASTKPAPPTGTFAKWVGSNETKQAQWIVRAWMIMAGLGVDRAYLFYFNDDDDAHVHGSSGLTRKFAPKPAFFAAAWLQSSLGDYRFGRVLREDAETGYAYEFVHGGEPSRRVVAVWKPAGDPVQAALEIGPGEIERAERMPLSAKAPESIVAVRNAQNLLEVPADGSPVFVWVQKTP